MPETHCHASPIGVIDSGVGGLSVLQEIRRVLPSESLHYFADSAWCPYGPRGEAEIRQRVSHVCEHLMNQGAKAIVIACNSATIAAIEYLRNTYPIPFIGMEPAVKPAAKHTTSGTIGILATEASLEGEKFHRLVHTHAEALRVITKACPEFVQLVEAGILDGPKARKAVDSIVLPIVKKSADVIVLGCSHYPFLRPLIEKSAGTGITIIDTGFAVAHRVQDILHSEHLLTETDNAQTTIETTGDFAHLKTLFPILCPMLSQEPGLMLKASRLINA